MNIVELLKSKVKPGAAPVYSRLFQFDRTWVLYSHGNGWWMRVDGENMTQAEAIDLYNILKQRECWDVV